MAEAADKKHRVDCMRCRAFFITYEVRFPYGCTTFGIKSRSLPAAEVHRSSGDECAAFDPRPPLQSGKDSPRRQRP
jgi:hypothetical protein